jgi:hypothetical protein
MYPFAVRSILLTHLHFLTWEITLRAIPWLCLLIVVDYGGCGLIARKKECQQWQESNLLGLPKSANLVPNLHENCSNR